MNVGAVIQARMSSRRLPGKVLRDLHGQPILAHVVEIVRRGGADETVVATSLDASDEPILEFCEKHGVPCVRGPLDDVAERFRLVLQTRGWDAFVRVSADSPLLDYRLVAWAAEAIQRDGCDIATNIYPRTFPRGQSIEAVTREAFETGLTMMHHEGDREHVTPVFYRHADQFGMLNLRADRDYGRGHLAIDTAEDFALVERVVGELESKPWAFRLEEIVAAFERSTALARSTTLEHRSEAA